MFLFGPYELFYSLPFEYNVIEHASLSSTDFILFFKINPFENVFQEQYQSVKQFEFRPGPKFLSEFDLGPNCLQYLSTDDSFYLKT